MPATNRHADFPFLIGRRSTVVQSERGNQLDGFWLAREDLATHYTRSNTVGFWFSSRASSGQFATLIRGWGGGGGG